MRRSERAKGNPRSAFRPATIICPACDTLIEVEESDSVHAGRRPDLRAVIIDGTFQQMNCPSCDVQIQLEPQFNHLAVGQSPWIAVFPPRMTPEYIEVEDSVTDVFDNAYGQHA